MPKPFRDLSGLRFGDLTAVSCLRFKGVTKWVCKCDCGSIAQVSQGNLCNSNSKSCGCRTLKSLVKHRDGKSSEYHTWIQMNQRCSNPNHHEYHNYGSRGISVCKQWDQKITDSAYKNFIQDMGRRPEKTHSLDRIDNNSGYSPANCQWADKKFQRLNQRSRVNWLTHNGKTLCLSDWARDLNVSRSLLDYRLKKNPDFSSVISSLELIL